MRAYPAATLNGFQAVHPAASYPAASQPINQRHPNHSLSGLPTAQPAASQPPTQRPPNRSHSCVRHLCSSSSSSELPRPLSGPLLEGSMAQSGETPITTDNFSVETKLWPRRASTRLALSCCLTTWRCRPPADPFDHGTETDLGRDRRCSSSAFLRPRRR